MTRVRKTIFGKRGNFDGEDFLEMIVAQPQAGALHHRQALELFRRRNAVGGTRHGAGRYFPQCQ